MVNDIPPYTSSIDAMSKFPETATALGLTLDEEGQIHPAAPEELESRVGTHFFVIN